MNLIELKELRGRLHQNAELAFEEHSTAFILKEYLSQFRPDQVIENIGKTGLAFVFKGEPSLPCVMFRGDMDALPIEESGIHNNSVNSGVSHKCGHDGHMAIVCSVASVIGKLKKRGDIILFFQPAEEVGLGAKLCDEDEKFKKINPDFIFGLHNIPGVTFGKILLKEGTFSCASMGMKILVEGESSHAAYPEHANSPFNNFSNLLEEIMSLNSEGDDEFFLTTLTHLRLGEESFGITPGQLESFLTLRAINSDVLNRKKSLVIDLINNFYEKNFKLSIEQLDYFDAVINKSSVYMISKEALDRYALDYEVLQRPIRWSEDFGFYNTKYNPMFFGLGMGDGPDLHSQHYDFNDNLISRGQELYFSLLKQIFK